jgi:hypothetical protein
MGAGFGGGRARRIVIIRDGIGIRQGIPGLQRAVPHFLKFAGDFIHQVIDVLALAHTALDLEGIHDGAGLVLTKRRATAMVRLLKSATRRFY